MPEELSHIIRHLRLEALSLAMLMTALTYVAGVPLWLLVVLFPVFDVGMIGYVLNSRIGALTYNFSHNATTATFFIMFGALLDSKYISFIGFCWTFHIAVDRLLGFGLKYKTTFYRTHLGEIAAKGMLSMSPSAATTVISPQPAVQAPQYSASQPPQSEQPK